MDHIGLFLQLSFAYRSSIVIFKNFPGQFEFNDVFCHCTSCSNKFVGCSYMMMIMSGFWPASPVKASTFYSVELLQFWENLSNNSPGTSLSSFIRSIEGISKNAGQVTICLHYYTLVIVILCFTSCLDSLSLWFR